MYAKLAIRNVKRSAKDYLIYMVTLILSVGMFYGFFSIVSPYYNLTLPITIHLELLSQAMRIAVPAVGLLIMFLINFVNNYMLRRKQKEFAIQTIIGMEQRTVAWIFFLETTIIGAVAILMGILLGMFISQIISIVVIRAFGAEYHLHVTLFPDTVLWTVLFFGSIFLLMGIKNIRTIRSKKVIAMLQNSQKGTDLLTLHQQLWKWAAVVSVVSLAAFGMMFPLVVQLPLTAPLKVTTTVTAAVTLGTWISSVWFLLEGRNKKTGCFSLLVLTFFSLSTGIFLLLLNPSLKSLVQQRLAVQAYVTMPPLMGLFLVVFSVIALFSNLSWIITKAVKKNESFYYDNLFFIGQLKSRLGSCSKTMGMITAMLIASIVLFAWLPIMAVRIHSYQLVMSAFDIQAGTMFTANEETFPTGTLDYAYMTDYLKQNGHSITGAAEVELFTVKPEAMHTIKKEYPILAVARSDYNDLRGLSDLLPITLPEDAYAVAWSNTALPETVQTFHENAGSLKIGDVTLDKVVDSDYQDMVGIGLFTSRTEAVYIIPDQYCRTLPLAVTYYAANTKNPLTYEFAQQLDLETGAYQRTLGNFLPEQFYLRLHTLQVNEGISNMLMLALTGAYGALVLIVISLTMLSVQQLTDAEEQKQRFQIIVKLGVDKQVRSKYIRRQMLFWFGIPVLTALIGSMGVLAFLIHNTYKEIVAYLTMGEVWVICGIVYIAFFMVLFCYFSSTYFLFKKYAIL